GSQGVQPLMLSPWLYSGKATEKPTAVIRENEECIRIRDLSRNYNEKSLLFRYSE
ncbi:hypothetical protein SK128_018402, partial [Halocaridina rubra]